MKTIERQIIEKQDELLKLLLRNYTSEFFPIKKETYIKRVKCFRKQLSALKSQLSEPEKDFPDINFRRDIAEELSREELIDHLCEMNEVYQHMRTEWFEKCSQFKTELKQDSLKESGGKLNKTDEDNPLAELEEMINTPSTDEEKKEIREVLNTNKTAEEILEKYSNFCYEPKLKSVLVYLKKDIIEAMHEFASQFQEQPINSELNDIIKCILAFDKTESFETKGRYFEVIQRDLSKLNLTEQPAEQITDEIIENMKVWASRNKAHSFIFCEYIDEFWSKYKPPLKQKAQPGKLKPIPDTDCGIYMADDDK